MDTTLVLIPHATVLKFVQMKAGTFKKKMIMYLFS